MTTSLEQQIEQLQARLKESEATNQLLHQAMVSAEKRGVDKGKEEIAELKTKVQAYDQAIEREKKPDCVKWHKDLADNLDILAKGSNDWANTARPTLESAARELRSMADSFTLKANFVPAELRIKELEASAAAMRLELQHFSDPTADQDTSAYAAHLFLIATSAGKELLERLERYEILVSKMKPLVEMVGCKCDTASHGGWTCPRCEVLTEIYLIATEALKSKGA